MRGAVNTLVLGFEMLKKECVVRHLLADRTGDGRLENSHNIESVVGLVVTIPDQVVIRLGD